MILKFKKRKELELKRKELVLALPSFINQLILFLNSGMVLSEAMASISSNYERTGRNKVNEWLNEPGNNNNGKLVNIPYKETSEYVVNVAKAAENYKELYFNNEDK